MRKKFISLLLWIGCCCSPLLAVEDYVWTTPSFNSSESMPLGGGDIGMNVWVDYATNEVHCLVTQSGSFDDNNTLLKFGLLRIQLEDPKEAMREQRLCLEKGSMKIAFEKTEMELWVDVFKPVIHIEANHPVTLTYESWRDIDRRINRFVSQQTSWKWAFPKDIKTYTYKDEIVPHPDGTVTAWHQNTHEEVFMRTLEAEHMLEFRDSIYNPIKDRISGGRTIKVTNKHKKGDIYEQWQVALLTQQSTKQQWIWDLDAIIKSVNSKDDKEKTQNWWQQFWERSFIVSNGEAKEALRNYNLFRYMLGCNAHPAKKGERWPTKFNGGLFTFNPVDCDRVLHNYDRDVPGIVTPDYRRWGGGTHTAQNQRLVYWPLLQTGDFDALQNQLDFYSRILPAAELRTRYYWGHRGACFTEQIENFGLPNIAEYGKHRTGGDPGVEDNRWVEYEWDTALEFAEMYCLYPHHYSPHGWRLSTQAARNLIMSCLRFFDEHYPDEDAAGHKIFYPGSACETYKITRNSASTIAALKRVCYDALRMRSDLELDPVDIAWIIKFRNKLPEIPTRRQNGLNCIAPAESWERIQNSETPQLYPLWPWKMVDSTLAANTYYNDTTALNHRDFIGWRQDNIWAAYIGNTKDAWDLTMKKLVVKEATPKSEVYRFPAFWGPGYDWMPDHNWGGSAMIGLHAMLMQEDGNGQIKLLPAWPKDQDVHFRLWASRHRLVEVEYKGGKIVSYTINGHKRNPYPVMKKMLVPNIDNTGYEYIVVPEDEEEIREDSYPEDIKPDDLTETK